MAVSEEGPGPREVLNTPTSRWNPTPAPSLRSDALTIGRFRAERALLMATSRNWSPRDLDPRWGQRRFFRRRKVAVNALSRERRDQVHLMARGRTPSQRLPGLDRPFWRSFGAAHFVEPVRSAHPPA